MKKNQKPTFTTKKIKLNYFLSQKSVFESIDNIIFTPVLSYDGGGGDASGDAGGGGCASCAGCSGSACDGSGPGSSAGDSDAGSSAGACGTAGAACSDGAY